MPSATEVAPVPVGIVNFNSPALLTDLAIYVNPFQLPEVWWLLYSQLPFSARNLLVVLVVSNVGPLLIFPSGSEYTIELVCTTPASFVK